MEKNKLVKNESQQWFSEIIIDWYNKNKRSLPWRNTNDAYLIWLSEIILQQTRVEQGMSYYKKFVETFPSVKHLAKANEDQVLKLWQGLGYYSRARNLHSTAKFIVNNYKDKFPDNYKQILELKGVGEYTAAAISSFAFNLPYAVVDGNVYRVLSRVFGIATPIDSTIGKKQYAELAQILLNKNNPALHNQAIMEFGAIYCKVSNPDCTNCPLNTKCLAFANSLVNELPIKEKKTKVRKRFFNYLVFKNKKHTLIHRRTEKDIWQNLNDFPMIESKSEIQIENLLESKELKSILGKNKFALLTVSTTYKHILSHQQLFATFYEITVSSDLAELNLKNCIKIDTTKIHNYAVPRLVEKYLEDSWTK
jgi:A/G-specific adenine glycosylase